MKKRILISLAGGGAGFLLLTGFGGGCGHHPPRDPAELAAAVGAHVDDALDDLAATPAQRQQIHALADGLVTRGAALRKAGEPLHAEILAQWKSDSPDRARLHALVDQQLDAMRGFAHDAVDAGVDAHGVLTPEQRAKVTKKLERWHQPPAR